MTIKEIQRYFIERLTPIVGNNEARATASIIIEDVKGYKPIDIVLYGYRELLPETEKRMREVCDKVIEGMPVQYALGNAKFHGRNFLVTPATLIPRPETSQLIDFITKDFSNDSDLKVLDIGTGSGCIAISLALDLQFPEVTAIDISSEAIRIAELNAKSNKAKGINFLVKDIFDIENLSGKFDIIVSNPPYVLESEKTNMDKRVYSYEPAQALFVPDSDPLKFYKPIITYSFCHLSPIGKLYLEINPLCSNQLKDTLKKTGYGKIDVVKDYKGVDRFIIASL